MAAAQATAKSSLQSSIVLGEEPRQFVTTAAGSFAPVPKGHTTQRARRDANQSAPDFFGADVHPDVCTLCMRCNAAGTRGLRGTQRYLTTTKRDHAPHRSAVAPGFSKTRPVFDRQSATRTNYALGSHATGKRFALHPQAALCLTLPNGRNAVLESTAQLVARAAQQAPPPAPPAPPRRDLGVDFDIIRGAPLPALWHEAPVTHFLLTQGRLFPPHWAHSHAAHDQSHHWKRWHARGGNRRQGGHST